MLHIPGELLLIHIPRTAGNAITRTLCRGIAWSHSITVSLDPDNKPIHRHSTATELQNLIDDFDTVPKVAIDRPYPEILKSDYRMLGQSEESLSQFEARRWYPWLDGLTPWQYWCEIDGQESGVERVPYCDIDRWWGKMQKQFCIKDALPRIDWQKLKQGPS